MAHTLRNVDCVECKRPLLSQKPYHCYALAKVVNKIEVARRVPSVMGLISETSALVEHDALHRMQLPRGVMRRLPTVSARLVVPVIKAETDHRAGNPLLEFLSKRVSF